MVALVTAWSARPALAQCVSPPPPRSWEITPSADDTTPPGGIDSVTPSLVRGRPGTELGTLSLSITRVEPETDQGDAGPESDAGDEASAAADGSALASDAGSNDDAGTDEAGNQDASETPVAPDFNEPVGYLVELFEGELPDWFSLPENPIAANDSGTIAFRWCDGASYDQERIAFSLVVTPVDAAGNLGTPSDPIRVFDPGGSAGCHAAGVGTRAPWEALFGGVSLAIAWLVRRGRRRR